MLYYISDDALPVLRQTLAAVLPTAYVERLSDALEAALEILEPDDTPVPREFSLEKFKSHLAFSSVDDLELETAIEVALAFGYSSRGPAPHLAHLPDEARLKHYGIVISSCEFNGDCLSSADRQAYANDDGRVYCYRASHPWLGLFDSGLSKTTMLSRICREYSL